LGGAVGRIEEHEREWGGRYINHIKIKKFISHKKMCKTRGKKEVKKTQKNHENLQKI
jgi:hypothetical protein